MAKAKMSNYELRQSLYQRITDNIVSAIEQGMADGNWVAPWSGAGCFDFPVNAQTKKPYRNANVLNLWAIGREMGYASNKWATYNQWKKLGANVKKGEKCVGFVIFWTILKFIETNKDTGEEEETKIPFIKYSNVFNADQVEGYEDPDLVEVVTNSNSEGFQTQKEAEELIAASGAKIFHGGTRACYIPAKDEIHLPEKERFNTSSDYYATAFHELTHWTGTEERCDRDLTGTFGDGSYAMEELIAELGAAFTCSLTGVRGAETREDHAKYVKSWLEKLKEDSGAIMKASKMAQQAADYLMKHKEKENA